MSSLINDELNLLVSEMIKTHDSMPKCEVCGLLALSEWKKFDDGAYYTYRCEEHPETDPDYCETEVI